MKALFVIDGMHPSDGGPPRVVASSALALKELGVDVTVLTTVQPAQQDEVKSYWSVLKDSKIKLQFLRNPSLRDLVFSQSYENELLAHIETSEVVHIHSFWSPLTWFAAKVSKLLDRPYFISVHGVLDRRALKNTQFKYAKKKLSLKYFEAVKLLEHSSGVIFGSLAEENESLLPSQKMRVVHVANGVELPDASWTAKRNKEKVDRLESIVPAVSTWDRVILYFSRMHPGKGLDMLVEAFGIVAPQFPGVGLLAAGIEQDREFQMRVERLIADSGASKQIALTTSLLGSDWHFLYSYCDLFALPSHAEGFSVALVEAMSHGAPALITRYCHMPEVETYNAGVIADPNVESLAYHLKYLLSLDPVQLEAIGKNARRLVEERYSREVIGQNLIQLYAQSIRS